MRPPELYAMDTCFGMGVPEVASYPIRLRCRMTRDAGYDATYLTLGSPEDIGKAVEQTAEAADVERVRLCAVYAPWSTQDTTWDTQLLGIVERLPQRCDLELAVLPGSKAGSDTNQYLAELAKRLKALADACLDRSSRLVIYPHVGFGVEHFRDAVDLVLKMDHDAVACVFCGFHWYAGGAEPLSTPFRKAGQRLTAANLSGVTRGGPVADCRLHVLGEGELDNAAVLSLMCRVAPPARLGVQGYGVGGDVFNNLCRSRQALADMLDRVSMYTPEWPSSESND